MGKAWLVALVLLIGSCAQSTDAVHCPHHGAPFAPPGFGSRADADTYVRDLYAGGRVALLGAEGNSVLVVYVHGAVMPDLAIAAYRASGGHWLRAAEWSGGLSEAHTALLDHGELVVVGKKTGLRCVLLKAQEQSGGAQ